MALMAVSFSFSGLFAPIPALPEAARKAFVIRITPKDQDHRPIVYARTG